MSILQDAFLDFEQPVVNTGKEPDIKNFFTIHSDDLEPVSIISPHVKTGPWIAGGAALRWYQGQPVDESDIDVFCGSAKQAADVIERVKSYGRYSVKYESENAVTLDYYTQRSSTKWTVQIITRKFFNSIEEVINSFDLTVCKIGTCGNEWKLGPLTARDIREKNLRFEEPLQPDALKRLVKYWTYGYRPVAGLIESVQENPIARWQFSQEEDYNNAF
jgi:hypothetical protein